MQYSDIHFDVLNGLISECRITEADGWYKISVHYSAENQWENLTLQRRGLRLYKSYHSALKVSEQLGFNEVTVMR
ncbi:MAG: hypothetical protein MJK10_19130 [Pseudomonadales bacterium]|nr:hypothetical protein [Pseudomonadales bacterium]NRA15247.1 hypothetical protein [Oceanospirillaceae bacterium]